MRNVFLFLLLFSGTSLCLGADVYPNKPVRVIVPYSPGGSSDTIVRVISPPLSEVFGKPFIAENRSGAGGTIANEFVARSAPDGYTLMVMDTSNAMAAGVYKSLRYDVAKDFTPIAQIFNVPNMLISYPLPNINTVKELIAFAQANPGKLNYGSAGVGSSNHLMAELFKKVAKVNIVHIPFKGGADAMIGLITNQTQMHLLTIQSAFAQIKSGKVRPLAVMTDGKRSPVLPNVPSMTEAGVPEMSSIYQWYGIVGPAGMPKEVVNKLNAEIIKVNARPLMEQFVTAGAELVNVTPEEFSKLINSEVRRWVDVANSAGITAE